MVETYLRERILNPNDNANVPYSIQGLNLRMVAEKTKTFWLEEVYPAEARRFHEEGLVYIHQLHHLTTYCVGWDLADLLDRGFWSPNGVRSGPPKHLRTALLQLANFLYSAQGEAAGAVAVSNFDTLLGPYAFMDGLFSNSLKQVMQEFLFNMNVPTRVGSQTPFTNITLDIVPPSGLRNSPAIHNGSALSETYEQLWLWSLRLVQALFSLYLQGDAEGRPFTFPIPTVDVDEEFPWDAPELHPLWEATARYGIPYFANYLSTGRRRDETRSMCCRLSLDSGKIRQGGLFSSHPLTGSIGVVTLNLPGIALRSRDFEDFLRGVRVATKVAIQALERKREFLEDMTERGLYPISRHYLEGVKEKTGHWWGQHFATLGVLGMHEALLNLSYERGIVERRDLALQTLRTILDTLPPGLWNLEATPAESACHTLAKGDLARFGERAHHQGSREAPFYTNSTQLPPGYTEDLFFVLEHQEPLQALYTGGTVLHIWLGEKTPSPEGVKRLVRRIFEHYRIPYITITPTFSVCPVDGYIPGNYPLCPQCGRETEVYSRVVGYLRPVSYWNAGKQEEFKRREAYAVPAF